MQPACHFMHCIRLQINSFNLPFRQVRVRVLFPARNHIHLSSSGVLREVILDFVNEGFFYFAELLDITLDRVFFGEARGVVSNFV
jgi:hypothetical protein